MVTILSCLVLVPSNIVIYNGYLYSTLADVPVNVNQDKCQALYDEFIPYGALPIPSGYAIADDNADSIAVTAAHYWSTDSLLMSNGKAYVTLRGPECCGYEAGILSGFGGLTQSGSSYIVTICASQVLISSKYLYKNQHLSLLN